MENCHISLFQRLEWQLTLSTYPFAFQSVYCMCIQQTQVKIDERHVPLWEHLFEGSSSCERGRGPARGRWIFWVGISHLLFLRWCIFFGPNKNESWLNFDKIFVPAAAKIKINKDNTNSAKWRRANNGGNYCPWAQSEKGENGRAAERKSSWWEDRNGGKGWTSDGCCKLLIFKQQKENSPLQWRWKNFVSSPATNLLCLNAAP